MVMEWLARAGPPPKPVMTFDNVEAIKSWWRWASGVDRASLSLGAGHVPMANTVVCAAQPARGRRVGWCSWRQARHRRDADRPRQRC
jgi:hypothetical protein